MYWGATLGKSPMSSSFPNFHSSPLHLSFEDVPFLFSPLPVLSFVSSFSFSPLHSFPSFSRSLPLSHSLLFFLPSPPWSSPLLLLPSALLPLPGPETGHFGSSLTRNTPTPASSIFCDGSGGSESPCAPASPWVRAQIGIAYCCKSPGGSCQICPWPPSRSRPQRNRPPSALVLRRADDNQDSASLVS